MKNIKKEIISSDSKISINLKRKFGKYFTEHNVSVIAANKIIELVNPDLIIEPFVGEGSLILPLVDKISQLIVNDISKENITFLKQKLANNNVKYFSNDFVSTPLSEIVNRWQILDNSKKLLVYSNPPFGTASTNKLASKKSENKKPSRKININYGGLDKKYGRGDLVIPAIGKMIELLKYRESKGYLAFFSPFGIFCGRHRYRKLLNGLLADFKYIYGEIFAGDNFHDVKKNKPISLTIWEYSSNIQTPLDSLSFSFNNRILRLKGAKLLKEFWRYDNRKFIHGEIVAQGNDRFNVMAPKMIHIKINKGGSELVKENIIKELNVPNLPSELIIGLWSCSVGHRSITSYPIYMDNAYLHLPDFSIKETQEILAYSALHILISELKFNYTGNKIGFNKNKSVIFGGPRLTKGVRSLFDTYHQLRIGLTTLGDILQELRSNHSAETLKLTLRKSIKLEMEHRLDVIGYWEFIPVPQHFLD